MIDPPTPIYPGSRLAPRVENCGACCDVLNLVAVERHAQEARGGMILAEHCGGHDAAVHRLWLLIEDAAVACQLAEAIIAAYPNIDAELIADYVDRGLCEIADA